MTISIDMIRELAGLSVASINNGVSKTLTGRLEKEIPPQDPRHLTDTRTRVSTLLEYALSYELNNLIEKRVDGYCLSNILWNVFPDLVIRDEKRNITHGIEVKALHTAAEEKSANLHTPLPIINKDRDFVLILIWGWTRETINGVGIVYPHIHDYGLFSAWALARIRDASWLSGQRVSRSKAFDLSSPMIESENDQSKFKAEEGNIGKLMRISLSSLVSSDVPYYEELRAENEQFSIFKKKAIALGLQEIAKELEFTLTGSMTEHPEIREYPSSTNLLAFFDSGTIKIGILAGPAQKTLVKNIMAERSLDIALHLTSKLEWKLFGNDGQPIKKGKKADSAIEEICQEVRERSAA
jgi:hypothetical protein